MTNLVSVPTFTTKIIVNHGNKNYIAGFCLSKISLQELDFQKNEFLHPKELAYLSNFQHSKRQYSYLLGRYCAKHAIDSYSFSLDHSMILIENGVFQQPVVSYPNKNIQVSITHTNEIGAALAFHEKFPMSVDIENICQNKIMTMRTQMTVYETQLAVLISTNAATQLTLLWTVKEALSKVLRCGFMIPFDLLSIEDIIQHECYFISHFKNFPQYKAFSFQASDAICSIVYPNKSNINLDVQATRKAIGEITT